MYQFNSILYFNSHRAIQFFTVFHDIYVFNYFTKNEIRNPVAKIASDKRVIGLTQLVPSTWSVGQICSLDQEFFLSFILKINEACDLQIIQAPWPEGSICLSIWQQFGSVNCDVCTHFIFNNCHFVLHYSLFTWHREREKEMKMTFLFLRVKRNSRIMKFCRMKHRRQIGPFTLINKEINVFTTKRQQMN